MSKSVGTALIGGGSGFVGAALSRKLQSIGYRVSIITRNLDDKSSETEAKLTSSTRNQYTWDEIERDGLPDSTDVLVNLAGRIVGDPMKRWDDVYKSEVLSSRVNTCTLLAKACAAAKQPPKVFISASAIGYYPPSSSIEFSENSECSQSQTWFTQMCASWELAASLPPSCSTRHVVARFGVVLGRHGGLISNIWWPTKLGVGGCLGDGSHWLSWVHINDAVDAVCCLIEQDHLKGAFNITAPQPVPYKELVNSLAGQMWRPAIANTPVFAVNWLFGEERSRDLILANQRVLPTRLLQEAKYEFQNADIASAVKCMIEGKDY